MTVPIPDFYWLLDGQLLAGEYPGSWTRSGATEKLGLFLAAGIRTFIDVTDDTDPHATTTPPSGSSHANMASSTATFASASRTSASPPAS